ncbi:hypothetical protein [Acetobacter okinawensis]|uniref:Pirin n=1 Tax=Acetobacter okinawensis TaxID=1076594 RepID=A0A252BUB9_9PROT|nr:hypothetical protein [Acetobacter okinawensis]OUJ12401.1 pirin [Acetobacter okinawensis]
MPENTHTLKIRRADSLGHAHSDTLILRCHFAFADYQASEYGHEGRLRAINLGSLPPNGSYALGPQANVDIVTWLQAGSVQVEAEGFASETIHAGGLHLLSAGAGVNAAMWQAGQSGASFIQFWLLADTEGDSPKQESREEFPQLEDGGFRIIASGFPEDDPETMEVIADGAPVALSGRNRLLHAQIPKGQGAAYQTTQGRDLHILVVSGEVTLSGTVLSCGDGAMLEHTSSVVVLATQASVVLLTDIAS